ALVEIACGGVMDGVRPAPVVVRGEGEHADGSSHPVVDTATGEQRSVATIMLQHEQAHEEACGGDRQDKTPPIALRDEPRGRGPQSDERHESDDDLRRATAGAWPLVSCEQRIPGPRRNVIAA